MNHAVRRRTIAALAILTLAALAGCQRKVTLAQGGADSTAAMADDSLTALMRDAQRAWEESSGDDDAAALTARAVFEDLRMRPPNAWRGRVEDLLDSLGVGTEVGGSDSALVVNLFLRSDPGRGSWPHLYWWSPSGPRYQPIEGKGLKLLDVASRGHVPAGRSGVASARIAALYSRSRSGRAEPLLFVWGPGTKSDRWSVVQTLGPDSLGGYGGGAFDAAGDSIDLVVRTYSPLPRFDECVACPHVVWAHRFRWTPAGFERRSGEAEPSTYATFVRFVQALAEGREDPALLTTHASLVDDARMFEWDRPKGVWRVAPGSETDGLELTMFRGPQESYRVTFEPRGRDWLVSAIESVTRTVE